MAKRASTVEKTDSSTWTAQTLPRLILIIGGESSLRDEALAKIRKAAFGDTDAGMNWLVLYGPVNINEADALTPASFLDEVCTSNMFATDDALKVVIVRQADVFLSDKDYREMLIRAQERIPETSVLVLESPNAGKLKTTNFYKSLEASGAVLLCEALTDKWGNTTELELAIERHAADRKLKLSPAAHRALLERSARNLSMIDEELDKLVLALKPAESGQKTNSANRVRPVSEQDIAEFCSTTRTYDAFNLADAILDKNTKSALEILDTIFSRGISDASKPGKVVTSESSIAMLLLGAITWKVTQLQDQLIAFQTGKESGKNDFAIFGELKLFGARQESLKRALKKHNAASMRRCVEAIYRANLNLRRGGSKSQEVLEEMLWAMLKSV